MCVYVCVCTRVPQAGRAREGRGRWSHRARTDVVLTALIGEMPKGGPAKAAILGIQRHSIHKQQQNNSNNTHLHQSGHSHSALESEAPTAGGRGGGSGRMRYLCRPQGQLADTLEWPQGAWRTEGELASASDCSLGTRPGLPVCPSVLSIIITLEKAKLAPPKSQGHRYRKAASL